MRIGIFGGTFDPPHNAHIAIVQNAREAFALDKVLLVVSSDPPHKLGLPVSPANTRLEMTEIAVSGLDGVEVCDTEIKRGGKSYTVDTVAELKKLYPNDKLYFIVGEDSLVNFPKWSRPEQLLKMVDIIAVSRQGISQDILKTARQTESAYGAHIEVAAFSVPGTSSKEIRKRVYDALPVTGMLGEQTEKYIYENMLYIPEEIRSMQQKLKACLSEKKYEHTCGVVRTALALAEIYGEDPQKARIAALLHDCAKVPEGSRDAFFERLNYCPKEDEKDFFDIQHADAGAVAAKQLYNICDQYILSAIRSHTTGSPNMSRLDKIIYIADVIEPQRNYPEVTKVREIAFEDLDKGVTAAMRMTIDYCRKAGKKIHRRTIDALNKIKKEGKH